MVITIALLTIVISVSIASFFMCVLTIVIGYVLTFKLAENKEERVMIECSTLFSFVIVTFLVLMQWFSIDMDIGSFANPDNDHYKFFVASQDGVAANSVKDIFTHCINGTTYPENGGYYFLIQTIAFVAARYFDGNCILLQQLGSSAFFVWTSAFFCKILIRHCSADKVNLYVFYYFAFCPLILHSLGIHRDPHIAFFYMMIIYLSLCKKTSISTLVCQLGIAFVLYYFRQQHGLFAVSFVAFSLLVAKTKSKWMLITVVVLLIGVIGTTMIYNFIGDNLKDTNEYYDSYRELALDGLDSGIGRFVYMLPTPVKEVAQIIVLQMKFPPWGAIESANNFFAFIIGVENLLVGVFWFYIFVSLIILLFKYGYSQLPKTLRYGLVFIAIFLLLNSSNLDSRRVVCMYPFMFLPYLYFKENIASRNFLQMVRNRYIFIYLSLCVTYIIVKSVIG